MNTESEYRCVAPDIDRLLNGFRGGYLNPSAPTKELLTSMEPLFDALKDLKPLKKNEDAKAIWVMVPRGDISDYGDYEELLEYGDVSSYEEYESSWKEDYPDEDVWYELVLSEGKDYRCAALNNRIFINASLNEAPAKHSFDADAAVILCTLLADAAKKSMDLLRRGEYNSLVASSLPFCHRTGVVKRSIVWDAEPQMKDNIFNGLSEETYRSFKSLVASGANQEDQIGRIRKFTGNTFLKACAVGYRACGYHGVDLSLVDQYMLHADGRDEGLTGKGNGLCSGEGIDLDDPAAWDKWYFDKKRGGGHPYEVCRGGNSTHIDLFVRNDRDNLEWFLLCGKITEEDAREIEEKGGYYFAVAGNAWNRSVEAVKFYVALHNAGYPVLLRDADEILSRFEGEDHIGIVPHTVFPSYCGGMFPEKYGNILDFMHVYREDMEEYGEKIEWLPEDEAALIT